MEKVFGIGWAKTGTTTLGKCLEILGFDHQSQDLSLVKDIANNDLSRIIALAEKKESFEDWPWIMLYKELDETFPGSRFILTKRDSDKWIRSYRNMLTNQGDPNDEINQTRRTLYGLPFPDVSKEQLIERYETHNSEVEHYFRERSKDLLIVNWEKGQGWKELCEFLGKEIPNEPFPQANKGKYQEKSKMQRLKTMVKKSLQ